MALRDSFVDDLDIFDDPEEVIYYPRGTTTGTSSVEGFHTSLPKKEAKPSYGEYLSLMSKWSFKKASLGVFPTLGSTFTDDDDITWTVVSWQDMDLTSLYDVHAINLELLFTTTLTLQIRSTTKNRAREIADEWVSGATFNCSVQPLSAKSKALYGQRNLNPDYRFVVPTDLTIPDDDVRFLDAATGTVYEVLGLDDIRELDMLPVVLGRKYSA